MAATCCRQRSHTTGLAVDQVLDIFQCHRILGLSDSLSQFNQIGRWVSHVTGVLPHLVPHVFDGRITGFDAEVCWPLNGPLFSPLNPLYSLMGVEVTGPPLSTNWSGWVLQAICSVMRVCWPRHDLNLLLSEETTYVTCGVAS